MQRSETPGYGSGQDGLLGIERELEQQATALRDVRDAVSALVRSTSWAGHGRDHLADLWSTRIAAVVVELEQALLASRDDCTLRALAALPVWQPVANASEEPPQQMSRSVLAVRIADPAVSPLPHDSIAGVDTSA
jgi:hypothetical protein